VAVGVHRYHPHIGGSELHARCFAEGLAERGYEVTVIAPREAREPARVGGIRVTPDPEALAAADVLLTYSVSPETMALGRRAETLPLRWVHHPCAAAGPESLDLVRRCHVVLAMNAKDVALALSARGDGVDVVRITPASHPTKRGDAGDDSVRRRLGVEGDFILWAGAWLRAKGPRNLSRRFMALRGMRPDLDVKLVMFGGYGEGLPNPERPDPHPDIVCVDGDESDLPAALAQCAFLAFNSAPHPIGYDANPLILLEALMNGKTFVAQSGTPFVGEIAHLGKVVDDDAGWVRAAARLLDDSRHREWLERRCLAAHRHTYNLPNMLDGVERAIARAALTPA
jgi:glycosyltransferase involved in cell wall biosynthesis